MMNIRPIEIDDVYAIASLHVKGIEGGFISSLGVEFVEALYEVVILDKTSFGFVADDEGNVVGFIAFTVNLNRLYRRIILKSGVRFAFILAGKLLSLKRIKKVCETFFYPSRTARLNLPNAELLAVVIASDSGGKGFGAQLTHVGLEECAKRGIGNVKVMVGKDNIQANKLYSKCGFELICQIDSHGVASNIYVADTQLTC